MAALHDGLLSPWLRSMRLRAAQRYVSGRVLDYGCGEGQLAHRIANPTTYVGIDRDPEVVAAASANAPGGARFAVGDHRSLPDERFDTIVMLAVIEHLPQPADVLEALLGVLDPGGRVLITTPAPLAGPVHTLGARIGLFSAHAAEEHEKLFDRSRIDGICEGLGLEVERFRRFAGGLNQFAVLVRA